jgi:hypothetical protein
VLVGVEIHRSNEPSLVHNEGPSEESQKEKEEQPLNVRMHPGILNAMPNQTTPVVIPPPVYVQQSQLANGMLLDITHYFPEAQEEFKKRKSELQ